MGKGSLSAKLLKKMLSAIVLTQSFKMIGEFFWSSITEDWEISIKSIFNNLHHKAFLTWGTPRAFSTFDCSLTWNDQAVLSEQPARTFIQKPTLIFYHAVTCKGKHFRALHQTPKISPFSLAHTIWTQFNFPVWPSPRRQKRRKHKFFNKGCINPMRGQCPVSHFSVPSH